MTSTSPQPGPKSIETRLRELELMEAIANQGLEIASLKRQVCLVQLEKIGNERQFLTAQQPECSNTTESQTPDRKAS